MSHHKTLYKKLSKVKHISEMLPLWYRKDDRTIVCRDGSFVSVLKLTGKDYTGMSVDKYNAAYAARKAVFESNKDYIDVDIISIKRKQNAKARLPQSDIFVLNLVNDAWSKNFDEVYRTSHYLVLTTKKLTKVQQVGKLLDASYNVDLEEELITIGRDLINQLDDYQPSYLEKGELNSFFASLINGRETETDSKILNDPTFNQCIANQSISFPPNKPYCLYGKNDDAIYSGWLSVANYPDKPSQKTLEGIFDLPAEFIVYQSFQGISEQSWLKKVEKKANQIKNFGKHSDNLIQDLKEVSDKVSNGEFSTVEHYFSLEVLAPTEEKLDEDISLLRSKLQNSGALYFRESLNIEPLFWSRFPTSQSFNVRHRPITSENAAHFATFNSIGEGFDTCAFGHRPVTLFKTTSGSQYSFTFHDTPQTEGQPLGHTAIFGGTNTGKSTLASFLTSQCLPFEGFKAIMFDRLHGLEVFTRMMDGDYLDFAENVDLNPFQIDDTIENRTFLNDWLARLLGVDERDTESLNRIDTIVRTNFKMDRSDRGFEALETMFGKEGSELRERLVQWLPGGSYGSYFNGTRDSLRFEKDIVSFDASLVLEMPDLLPHLTDYLFNRIWNMVNSKPVPHLIFMDEAQRYMVDRIFVNRTVEFGNEIRKRLGILMLAFQNASKMQNLPEGAGEILRDAMANFIIYPNRTADPKSYKEFLGLNETEFNWVRTTNPKSRQVLFKRRESGESVILDVNLASLNTTHFKLLDAFDSGANAVKKINKLRETHPEDWKQKYLLT